MVAYCVRLQPAVSWTWSGAGNARLEIAYLLRLLGDEEPRIKPTIARGIIGVKTHLDPRDTVERLRVLFQVNPNDFQFTLKWVPIDLWTNSDIESLKTAVEQVKDRIKKGEHWRMTVKKRRYTSCHTTDVISALAELIDEKVNLSHPDKILRVDIMGKYAGVSVLSPNDIFSTTKKAT